MPSRSSLPNSCHPEDKNSRARHSLLPSAPIGICSFYPEGSLLSANQYISEILGYDHPETLKDAVTDFAAEIFVDSRECRKIFTLLGRHGRVSNHECRFRRRDGSEVWVSISARAIPNKNTGSYFCQAFITDITERILREKSLSENEDRLATVIAAIDEGVWDWNIETNTTCFDPGYFLVAGYKPDEFAHTYHEWEKRLHPEDLEPCRKAIADHLSGKTEKLDMEFRFRHKQGGWMWIRGRGRIVQRDLYGNPLRMVGTHTDISARKKAEEALLESEERFFKAFNSSPAAQVISDIYTGKIIDVNSRCLELTGYTREELIGMDARKIPVWSNPAERDRIVRKLKNNKYFKDELIEFKTKNGESIKALWSAESATLAGRKVMLSMFYDDTQRRLAEEKLKDSEEKYHALMEQCMDMVCLHDLQGRILEVNQTLIDRTSYSREQLLNMSIFDLYADISGRQEILRQWRDWSPGQSVMLEIFHVDSQGNKYPVEINTGKVCFGHNEYILALIRDATERRRTQQALREARERYQYLLQSTSRMQSFHNIIGRSREMQHIFALMQQVAGVDTTVLVTGETGTGKELIVDALHALSHRSQEPLIKVNCLTLSEDLLESELFGHIRGAFTGAYYDKIGRVEAAEGGTLFLDEIGDLPPRIQLKLLRFLQEREYERVGESITRKSDVRVVAATNADLAEKVEEGTFRKDLYYRLKVMSIHVPPLRERREDIPQLIEHYCKHYAEKFGKPVKGVLHRAMRILMHHSWPGNVRELEHALEHGALLCPGEKIGVEHLPRELLAHHKELDTNPTSRELDQEMLARALQETQGNKTRAARKLGISRRTIYRKLHEYGLLNTHS